MNRWLLFLLILNFAITTASSVPSAFHVIYQFHDAPSLPNPIVNDYLNLTPELPVDRSWVKYSAFVYPSSGEITTITEIALINVYSTNPGVGDFDEGEGLDESYILIAKRSGEQLSQALESVKKDNGIIPRGQYPKLNTSTVERLSLTQIYTYSNVMTPHDYPPLYCSSSSTRSNDSLRRRLGSQTGSFFRLIPLTDPKQYDLLIQLEYKYLTAWKIQDQQITHLLSYYLTARDVPNLMLSSQDMTIDLNRDGVYELITFQQTFADGYAMVYHLPYVTYHRWDNTVFIEDNKMFYQTHHADTIIHEFQKRHEELTEYHRQRYGDDAASPFFDFYEFYMGVFHYYRENDQKARFYLTRVIEQSGNKCFVEKAAQIVGQLE